MNNYQQALYVSLNTGDANRFFGKILRMGSGISGQDAEDVKS